MSLVSVSISCPVSYVGFSSIIFSVSSLIIFSFPPKLRSAVFKLWCSWFTVLGFLGACGGKKGWVEKLISEFSCVTQVF